VQYDSGAQIVMSSVTTDRAGKDRLRGAIREIALAGGTNLHGGMMLGRDALRSSMVPGQMSRLILLSDGQANAGVVDPSRIADAARAAADEGLRITAVGLGLDYNEDLMEAIAESGRGNYYYVKDAPGLAAVLAGELTGLQSTVATGVELHLRSGCPGAEIAEVMGYESRRDGDTVVVPMADLFGSDGRKLLVRLRVPDAQVGKLGALTAELRFRDPKTGAARTARVALGLEVTGDEQAAAASVDQGVIAQVMSAQASHAMRQAAAAYDRGDVAGAAQVIDASSTRLEAARVRYKVAPSAAAPAMDSLREMKAATANAQPGSDAGKHVMKASKAKARGLAKGKF
jgi:Ca-activated chloride channel family protein